MTKEDFIEVLKKKRYPYKIERDKMLVTYKGDVWLDSLKTIPPGVQFKNGGYVYLNFLKTLHPSVEFKNKGGVDLGSLETLHPGVEFKNKGDVYLKSLIGGEGWFRRWSGNIDGIDSKRLLNFMISKGMFI